MRAMEGAIEEVEIDPRTFEVNYRVIGDTKPIGICGMIDILARLDPNGVINQEKERSGKRLGPSASAGAKAASST